jgi:hypothetical protein
VICWLFSGVAIDLHDKPVMRAIAYVVPANWGTAAAASSVDLPRLDACGSADPQPPDAAAGPSVATIAPCDQRWRDSFFTWLTDLLALLLLAAMTAIGADAALAHREPLESLRRHFLAAQLWAAIRRKLEAGKAQHA